MMQPEADYLIVQAPASATPISPLARTCGAGASRGTVIAAMLIALVIVLMHVILVRANYHAATPLWGDAALLSVVLLFVPTWIVEMMAGAVPDVATTLIAVLAVATPTPGANNVPPLLKGIWHIIVSTGELYSHYCGPLSVAIVLAVVVLRTPSARCGMLYLLFGAVLWLKFVPLFNPPRYWLGSLAIGFALSAAAVNWTVARLHVRAAQAELPLIAYLIVAAILALLIGIGLAQRSGAAAMLSGTMSHYDYLAGRVRTYQAIGSVKRHAAPDTDVATVNMSHGNYLNVPYLNEWFVSRFARLRASGEQRTSELTGWCRAGVQLIVFYRGVHEYNPDDLADFRPHSILPWLRTPELSARAHSRRGVDVIAVQPCRVLSGLQ